MVEQIRPTRLEKETNIRHFFMKWFPSAHVENLLGRKAQGLTRGLRFKVLCSY